MLVTHQEEVGGEREPEERAFDDHEPHDAPPVQAARPELVRRQARQIIGEARFEDHVITGSGWRLSSLGQNHAAMAIALGIAPNRTAQGEKIEETNRMPTATAAMNGHRLAA